MTTVVIMPGGFHPFHAGHAALYNSARRAFPDAEVFVAATNDTSARPFPFAVKEKLAKLAGVEPGHFVQVKSPFRAEEITAQFDPAQDRLIFVRSEKDANKPPQAGGVKKDGSPAYLQPLMGARRLEPFARHAYMAYLPTVEFGPGMTSATEIRAAWPRLNDQRKTALVMSLYPKTQTNPRLATNVVKLLDTAIGGDQGVAEGKVINTYLWHGSRQKIPMLEPRQSVDTGGATGSNQNAIYATSDPKVAIAMGLTTAGSDTGMFPNDPQMVLFSGKIRKGEYVYLHKLPFNGPDGKPQFVQGGNSREFHSIPGVEGIKPIEIKEIPVNKYLNLIRKATPADLKLRKKYMKKQSVAEAAKKCPPATQDITMNLNNRQKAIDEYGYGPLNPDMPNRKFWMKKVDEWNLDSVEEAQSSLCGNCAAFDIRQDTLDCIAQGIDADSPEDAQGVIDAGDLGYCKFLKFKCASRRTCDAWVTGGPLMDKPDVTEVDAQNFVGGMTAGYQRRENQPVDEDYIDEKWSQKYKSSINCASPRGFSQRAHCQGRKK